MVHTFSNEFVYVEIYPIKNNSKVLAIMKIFSKRYNILKILYQYMTPDGINSKKMCYIYFIRNVEEYENIRFKLYALLGAKLPRAEKILSTNLN